MKFGQPFGMLCEKRRTYYYHVVVAVGMQILIVYKSHGLGRGQACPGIPYHVIAHAVAFGCCRKSAGSVGAVKLANIHGVTDIPKARAFGGTRYANTACGCIKCQIAFCRYCKATGIVECEIVGKAPRHAPFTDS